MGARFLVRRVASAAVTIFLIVLLNFVLFRAMPGSPERVLLGRLPGVTPELIEATRRDWALDQPLFPNQFVNVRMVVDVRHGMVLVPTAAIQPTPKAVSSHVAIFTSRPMGSTFDSSPRREWGQTEGGEVR